MAVRKQLAQLLLNSTNAESVYSPDADNAVSAEIDMIIVANVSGGALTFRLFHDKDGVVFDDRTSIGKDTALGAGVRFVHRDESGLGLIPLEAADSTIGCRTNTAGGVTITIYGRV